MTTTNGYAPRTRPRAPDARITDSQLERSYVKYGADIAAAVAEMIDQTQKPGWALVKTGLAGLDKMVTIAPRTVTVFAGRPQHGKSMWLKVLAKRAMADIEAGGGYERGERVFYVSLEEPGAKLGIQLGGMDVEYRDIVRREVDAADVRQRSLRLARDLRSLCVIEHPGVLDGRIAPAVSAGMVIRAIERAAADDGIRPTMILLDYLQLIKADGTSLSVRSKTDHVTAASNGAVLLSRTFNCPVIMAVQAGRAVDQRELRIPTMADLQWASAIEQDADTVLGIWRPWVDHAEAAREGTAKPVHIDGVDIAITETLMVLGIAKTRNDGSGGRRLAAHLDPKRFRAYSIDTREVMRV